MAQVKYGNVTVEVPFVLPVNAGKLSADEVNALSKPPRGVGLVCDDAAAALDKVGAALVVPPGITPAALREAGEKAEEIDRVIESVEVILNKLRQANLLLDAEAYDLLRKLNEQVKAQGKFDAEIAREFRSLTEFMTRKRRARDEVAAPAPTPA